jgi:hypothetical protein
VDYVVNNNAFFDSDGTLHPKGYGDYPEGNSEGAMVFSSHQDKPGEIYIAEFQYIKGNDYLHIKLRRLTHSGLYVLPKITEMNDFWYGDWIDPWE